MQRLFNIKMSHDLYSNYDGYLKYATKQDRKHGHSYHVYTPL